MAFAGHADNRPIQGAVATLGVSERVDFLRKTYGHLGVALAAWAALTLGIFTYATETSLKISEWALQGSWSWFIVLGAFMGIGWVANKLATSNTSRGLQYVGLGIGVLGEALILQPMLWVLFIKYGDVNTMFAAQEGVKLAGEPASMLMQAGLITMAIFGGLTATVFVTKKDFSFLRGILTIASFAFLGTIVASLLFGFHLGAIFAGFGVLLMAGYILFQTSQIMNTFPPTYHVAAALMLFSSIATLFWYVLRLVMASRD